MKHCVLLLILSAFCLACSDSETTIDDKVILNGLVHTGQPVQDIRVSLLSEINQPNRYIDPSEVLVVAFWRDEAYLLTEFPDEPGRYFDPLSEVIPEPGDLVSCVIFYESDTVISGSIAPEFPRGLNMPFQTIPLNAEDLNSGVQIPVLWENPEAAFYTGKVVLVSDSLGPINPFEFNEDDALFPLPITTDEAYLIDIDRFSFYGTYALILYRVNEDYVQFSRAEGGEVQFQQNSNVANGAGLFSVLSSDTIFFELIPG
ncbi:MAG: hypothetical protein AAFX87_29110 [Bacteroidota bacterium]